MNEPFNSHKNIAYHYTDMNALINILGKETISLRATNCLYLNDSQEIKESISSVKRVANVQLQEGAFRGYYLTSFSKSEDELSMWGMYAANGNGCAIGFDMDEIMKHYHIMANCFYGKESIDQYLNSFINLIKHGTITYIPYSSEEKGWSKKSILTEELATNQYILTCLGAKNIAYRIENEVRCIIDDKDKEVKFRIKNGVIIPYIIINTIAKSALKKIIIGPTNNSQLTMQSVIHFLQINDYDLSKIEIKNSNIPYRG